MPHLTLCPRRGAAALTHHPGNSETRLMDLRLEYQPQDRGPIHSIAGLPKVGAGLRELSAMQGAAAAGW